MRKAKKQNRISLWIGLVCLLFSACGENTVTVTPSPSPTPAPSPTTSVPPTLSPTIAPTTQANTVSPTSIPVPAPAFVPFQKQIGAANCCQNFNFAMGGRLYYYDQPNTKTMPGTYVINGGGTQPTLLLADFGNFSPDLSLVATSPKAAMSSQIIQVPDAKKLGAFPVHASQILFSPDSTKLVFLQRLPKQDGPEEPQAFELWASKVDGSGLKKIWALKEGASLNWLADNKRVVLTARDEANQHFGLWVVDTETAKASLIVESKGLNNARVSINGQRVVYAITLQGGASSGIWSVNIDGSEKQKFGWNGSWRWSSVVGEQLYYIKDTALWSYDFGSKQDTRITDPATLPLQISGDEWQIGAEDKQVAYRSSSDNSLYLVQIRP